MKNPLRALLPIHALRESRALRVVHEQTAAHAEALAAQVRAEVERTRLRRESDETVAAMLSTGPVPAAEAHWATHVAATLKQRAEACDARLPQLVAQTDLALQSAHAARAAHAACVRGHHKVREASRRLAVRNDLAVSAATERMADDEFSPRWVLNQRARAGS